MLISKIDFFGRSRIVVCDKQCRKAWGVNSRPKNQLSEDPDDYEFLSDGELGIAPEDPGTYEEGHGKPYKPHKHNKWCTRECERSGVFVSLADIQLKDFSVRIPNKVKP